VEKKLAAVHPALLKYEHQFQIALSPAQEITHQFDNSKNKIKSAILDQDQWTSRQSFRQKGRQMMDASNGIKPC
jgi:hypothetical protein